MFVCFIRRDAFVYVSRLVWPPQPLLPIYMPRVRPRARQPARNPPPPPPRPAAPAPAPAAPAPAPAVQAPPPPPPQHYVRQGAVTRKYCFNLFMLYDRHIY